MFRICRDALLKSYNSGAERPMDGDDLSFYTALAVCERLGRSQSPGQAAVRQLFVALDVALSNSERNAEDEAQL